MKSRILFVILVALLLVPGLSLAQQSGAGQGQHKTKGSMMQANMGKMATMMSKMSQIMGTGKMSPEQQKKCADITKQMSEMMREMSAPHDKQVQENHQRELRGIEETINPLFQHLVHP